jgi:hypothetical protein
MLEARLHRIALLWPNLGKVVDAVARRLVGLAVVKGAKQSVSYGR